MPGQTCNDYRRETMRLLKRSHLPQNHEMYKVQYRALPDDKIVMQEIEKKLLNACVVEARNPNNFAEGEVEREFVKQDSNGLKVHEFIRREFFVKDMTIPGKHVRINRYPNAGLNDAQRKWFGARE